MAQIVSQCVTNNTAQAQMREFLKKASRSQKFNPSAKKIVRLVSGQFEPEDLKGLHWLQALLMTHYFQVLSSSRSHSELFIDFHQNYFMEGQGNFGNGGPSFDLLRGILMAHIGHDDACEVIQKAQNQEAFNGRSNFDAKIVWFSTFIIS